MTRSNVGLVYRKELLEAFRDRRTLISMIVIPVLVIPLLMVAMGGAAARMVMRARQEIPPVMVLGGTNSPELMKSLEDLASIRLVPPSADYTNQISDKQIRAAVIIPQGFDAVLQRQAGTTAVSILVYGGEMKSLFAAQTLKDHFATFRDRVIDQRLSERDFPRELLTPFRIEQANVAPPKKVSGNIVGAIIPYILILMCLTGALHPAVDLTAGEKERGTIETILSSPVARMDLALGKLLVTFTAALSTTLLSLSSMGASFLLLRQLPFKAGWPELVIDLQSLGAVFLMMAPLALLFSAIMLAVGLVSRTPREANSYLQPLIMATIMPALASILPGVELNASLALIPIVNVSLVSKEILSGTFNWDLIAIIVASTLVYASCALAFTVRMFNREEVLFRT